MPHTSRPPLWLNGVCGVAWLTSLVVVAGWPQDDVQRYAAVGCVFGTSVLFVWALLRKTQPAFAAIAQVTQAVTWGLIAVSLVHVLLDSTAPGWHWLHAGWVLCMVSLCAYLYREQHRREALADEVVNQTLEEARRALPQPQVHREAFLAAVSHELRTPMNAILGLNGTLRTQLADRPQDAAVVDLIRAATEQLLQVVNNILDFSRLQAKRLQLIPEPVALDALLTTSLQSYEVAARHKGLSLVLDAPAAHGVWVQADPKRLQQILHHLLDNALRVTNHGSITLRASRQAGLWRFEVQDTGPGIAAEQQAHLFHRGSETQPKSQPVHPSNPAPNRTNGTGLGLAICEQLVQLQRGQIGVRSQAGEGACFWFTLSLPAVVPPAPSSDMNEAAVRRKPWRMLVVDDHELNRVVATMMLQQQCPQATIVTSHSAQDALRLLQDQAFDVVWMDILMPQMDGMQATRELRAQTGPNMHTPVVAMTAIHQPEDRAACLAAGMQGMVSKPLQAKDLLIALAQIAAPTPPATNNAKEGAAT